MKIVASSFGSAGDFLPTLAIGAALRRRGHDVQFVGNPFYETRVGRAGLAFIPAGQHSDVYEKIEKNPAYSDPANTGLLLRDLVGPNSEATYRVIKDMLRFEPADIVVTNDANFGALWAAAEKGVPSVLVTASPVLWMSWQAPVVLGDWAPTGFLSRPITVAARWFMGWYTTRFLRPLAQQIGTSLSNVTFGASERMAAIRLGLWSPTLRGPVRSDPRNGTICGFARASTLGGTQPVVPGEVEAFLGAGPPPVIVALGSVYALTSSQLLVNIAQACADSDHRCLVVGHPLGVQFPSNTLAVRYAPYDQVLSRAAAVVVHGGAGTTGEALRCGRPIIGVPLAFDQFTLCSWIEKLGVGTRVPVAERSRSGFVSVLQRVLSDDSMRRRAMETGGRFAEERDGAESAADAIESLATQRLVGKR